MEAHSNCAYNCPPAVGAINRRHTLSRRLLISREVATWRGWRPDAARQHCPAAGANSSPSGRLFLLRHLEPLLFAFGDARVSPWGGAPIARGSWTVWDWIQWSLGEGRLQRAGCGPRSALDCVARLAGRAPNPVSVHWYRSVDAGQLGRGALYPEAHHAGHVKLVRVGIAAKQA